MAKQYGFQYELVQYKWPRWLHQQTEKQRIIWGYKILFLDVLFPLAVDKILFVDADQVRLEKRHNLIIIIIIIIRSLERENVKKYRTSFWTFLGLLKISRNCIARRKRFNNITTNLICFMSQNATDFCY